MISIRKAVVIPLIFILTLTGCGTPAPTWETSTSEPTRTFLPTVFPSPEGRVTPSPPPTELPSVPCDPAINLFCISAGSLVLGFPILPTANDQIERAYAYASTAEATRMIHHGVEFVNAAGTMVVAAAAGKVFFAGDDTTTLFSPWSDYYGQLVILEHDLPGQDIYTLYAHLSSIYVIEGQQVDPGEKIGEVGASGSAIGSHLHFEVRLDPQDYLSTQNPELWLIPHTGTGVMAVRFVRHLGAFTDPEVSIQYYPTLESKSTASWDPDIYPENFHSHETWETTAIGGMPAGHYRIVYHWNGTWQERWVAVNSQELTQVEISLDQ